MAEYALDLDDVKADLTTIMAYDNTTAPEVLTNAKKRLTYYKHNIENCVEPAVFESVLAQIGNCQEKVEQLKAQSEGKNIASAPEINPEKVRYTARDLLGSGQYGSVYRATFASSPVAVKVPKNPRFSKEMVRMFKQEANIMAHIMHSNIVQFLGACYDPSHLMIVTALMKTDLGKLIHECPNPLTLWQKLKLAHESALGLYWIHDVCNMIHRDLKPENILVDENFVAHIGDFGFTQILRGKETKDVGKPLGTVLYMAPEVIKHEPFDFSSDVHSFGFILFELFTGVRPFPDINEVAPFVEALCRDERPPIRKYPEVPVGIMDIAERCWRPKRDERPTMEEVHDAIAESFIDVEMPSLQGPGSNPANMFWKKYFLKPSFAISVPWSQFQELLENTMSVKNEDLAVIGRLLCEHVKGHVSMDVMTMERFQRYFLWFGRWFESPGEPLISEMVQLFQSPWYLHEIEASRAQMLLSGRPGGTFLVRLSLKDRRTPFALSFMPKGKSDPTHIRIHRLSYDPAVTARYSLPGFGSFQTIPELVDALTKRGIFTAACPPEPLPNAYTKWT